MCGGYAAVVMVILSLSSASAAQENPFEGFSERLHLVGVEERVDGRVGVRQNDGGEQEGQGHVAGRAQKEEAVDDVQRDPADGEEEEHEEERRCRLHLLLDIGGSLAVGLASAVRRDPPYLLLHREEDLSVDQEHDDEWRQDASEKVEVHHVGHLHYVDEEAEAVSRRSLVPAHERNQADEERQHPRDQDDEQRVARCHGAVVAEGHEDGHVAFHCHGQQAEDGALGQHDEHRQHEQTQVQVVARDAQTRHDGTGDSQRPHAHVCHCQRHQKVISDRVQLVVQPHSGTDQQVAHSGQEGDDELCDHVRHVYGRWRFCSSRG